MTETAPRRQKREGRHESAGPEKKGGTVEPPPGRAEELEEDALSCSVAMEGGRPYVACVIRNATGKRKGGRSGDVEPGRRRKALPSSQKGDLRPVQRQKAGVWSGETGYQKPTGRGGGLDERREGDTVRPTGGGIHHRMGGSTGNRRIAGEGEKISTTRPRTINALGKGEKKGEGSITSSTGENIDFLHSYWS